MNEEIEGCLAATHPLLGVGVFVFLKTMGSWRLRTAPESPECHALGKEAVGRGFRWIVSGSLRSVLLDEKRNQAYLLQVEAREFRDEVRAQRFMDKLFNKIHEKGDLKETGPLQAGEHQARYALWIHHTRDLLRRKKKIEALMECAVYCHQTERLLRLKILSTNIDGLVRDKMDFLSILSSITCH